MRKEYIAPDSKCINLVTESNLMDGSNPNINSNGPTVDGSEIEELTRRQSIWDNWTE